MIGGTKAWNFFSLGMSVSAFDAIRFEKKYCFDVIIERFT